MSTALLVNADINGPVLWGCLITMGILAALIFGVMLPAAIREGNRVAQAEEDAAREDAAPQAPRPVTYLPTPDDAPIVLIYDARADEEWSGVLHDGIVHDASGILDPRDIGWRFQVERDGADLTQDLMGPDQRV